jgi:predicted metal-binding membrane protein
MSFIMRHAADAAGAFRMGVEHGVPPWLLPLGAMLLPFAGGIMNPGRSRRSW